LIAEETDGVVKYYHSDHLGSTRLITDASGAEIANYKFKPYGETESNSGTFSTDYLFTGKSFNADVALSYFGARFYDPESGRFITMDPARDGVNWYIYCNDSPLKYVDSNGKYARVVVDGNNISITLPINFTGTKPLLIILKELLLLLKQHGVEHMGKKMLPLM
jgi:RHS repeat-associated protein